ncbi:MAG: hypothetical protein HQM08_09085 [Candidatus Riflebacteria bacterium]|nr:hypothetical protein [Candidatus Riflebacteria bacterium]
MALFIRESLEMTANFSGKSAFSNSAPILQNSDQFIYGSGFLNLRRPEARNRSDERTN